MRATTPGLVCGHHHLYSALARGMVAITAGLWRFTTGSLVPDEDQGWFITEGGGLTADDVIVVVGASSMLSEELKAQGGGAPD